MPPCGSPSHRMWFWHMYKMLLWNSLPQDLFLVCGWDAPWSSLPQNLFLDKMPLWNSLPQDEVLIAIWDAPCGTPHHNISDMYLRYSWGTPCQGTPCLWFWSLVETPHGTPPHMMWFWYLAEVPLWNSLPQGLVLVSGQDVSWDSLSHEVLISGWDIPVELLATRWF